MINENTDFLIDIGMLEKYKGNSENVVIPSGVTNIVSCAFSRCKSLQSITIPDSVSSIGILAFDCCSNMEILVPTGSYAVEYAKSNGLKYREI